MTTKIDLPPVPLALQDVAHIDGPTCAAAAGNSLSSWHKLVRLKQAPQPVIRQPRFTRWRLADVRAWLIERTSQQCVDTAAAVTEKARKASAEARKPPAVAKAQATRKARIAAREGAAT
jgi:predicted DNA-binding transcriptional regulator AlpA